MPKRVVTGHDEAGKAVIVSSGDVASITPALAPGYAFRRLWSFDDPPVFPDDGAHPVAPIYFPPSGGARFMTVTFPPDAAMTLEGVDIDAAVAEIDEAGRVLSMRAFFDLEGARQIP